jgi:hypothetical protein
MEIKIVVDGPKGWKRRVLMLCGALVGVIALPVVIARAYSTAWIQSGQPVSAAALSADLDEVQTRLAALEAFKTRATQDGGFSLGATFCGATGSTNGQITNGYAGAKGLCTALSACGMSSTAHMCTTEDLSRSMQLGITLATGWYSAFVEIVDHNGLGYSDCGAWTNSTPTAGGSYWGGSYATLDLCNNSHPVLCCN